MTTLPKIQSPTPFLNTRRGRSLRENLTAYLFLFPASLIIFLFGLFPVSFAFFVSLHRWRRFPEEYQGFANYVRSLDHMAYVLFFWMALGLAGYALVILWRLWRDTTGERRALIFVLPGVIGAGTVLLFVRWFFTLLPVALDIPQRLRGQERVQGLFINELIASFAYPEVVEAGNIVLLAIILTLAVVFILRRLSQTLGDLNALVKTTTAFVLLGMSTLILQLMVTEIGAAVVAAQAEGTELPIWSQVILISLGALLVIGAYALWRHAGAQHDDKRFLIQGGAALLLLGGGYLLVAELPIALANADREMLTGFVITIMFALGTVPLQLAAGMGLAYLLFQKIKGKSLFRMLYFLPYITPFVATSVVFKILFSHRAASPINNILGVIGIPPQKWLLEPTGIGTLIFGSDLPSVLAGPSLALIVIMLYTVWTYIGYDAVVFLAGLGTIPPELYEAARIDGASGWKLFRYVTLPLLSPTTFFLSLIAIIGTFKAFTQIWIMRSPAASRSVDTVSVYIFETVRTNGNLGYGSAMAFVLFGVILLLTTFQNRIMGSRVFYG